MAKKEQAEYLGDGVYAVWRGLFLGVELRANDRTNPTDRIVLEPYVIESLRLFLSRHERADDHQTYGAEEAHHAVTGE